MPQEVQLPTIDKSRCEARWFPDLNKDWHVPWPKGRGYYLYTRLTEDKFSGKVIDLEVVQLLNLTHALSGFWGRHSIETALKEQMPAGYAHMGICLAEAMEGKPWPSSWSGLDSLACFGTIIDFTRSGISQHANTDPLYPQLKNKKGMAEICWRRVNRLGKKQRVPIYPLPPR